jgi:hypothetical protein
MSSRTNWAAVSALAACAGVFVAFLAYTTPHPYSPSAPTTPWSYPATLPWPGTTAPAPPQRSTPGNFGVPPTLVQPAGPPAGCQQADAAITKYDNTVGSSWYSKTDVDRMR